MYPKYLAVFETTLRLQIRALCVLLGKKNWKSTQISGKIVKITPRYSGVIFFKQQEISFVIFKLLDKKNINVNIKSHKYFKVKKS